MTLKEKRIADIRYFASRELPFTGDHTPGSLRPLYAFSKAVHAVGARVACKLRELGFTLAGYDHVYIVFTPALAGKAMRPAHVVLEPWQRHFSVGVDPGEVAAFDEAGREAFVIETTLRVLHRIAGADAGKRAMLRQVGKEIARDGENLGILHRALAWKTLQARISYRIHADGTGSGWAEIEELASGRSASVRFVDLQSHHDVHALVDRVALTNGALMISPRKSASSRLTVSRYRTPMRIDIEAALAGRAVARYSPKPAGR